MNTNAQRFKLSEDLIEILATYFRNAEHVEQFMNCIADRASGPLMKYLESTHEALRGEEAYMSSGDEDWDITPEEAEAQIANLRHAIREKSPEISSAKKILQECAALPPCFGAIWDIEPDAGNSRSEFPIVETVLLVETPEPADEVVQGIPISHWPEMASANDLVFQKSEFHPTIVVTPFLEQPFPVSRLKTCSGHLMGEELDALLDKLEFRDFVDESSSMSGSTSKNKIQAYFEPRRIFQEFMIIATTPLRLEALEMLDKQDEQVLENVVSFTSIRTRLRETQELLDLTPSDIPLAAHGKSDGPESVVEMRISEPESVFHITSKIGNIFSIELAIGSKAIFEGAKLVTGDGKPLAVIHDGAAEFEMPEEGVPMFHLADGTVISAGRMY